MIQYPLRLETSVGCHNTMPWIQTAKFFSNVKLGCWDKIQLIEILDLGMRTLLLTSRVWVYMQPVRFQGSSARKMERIESFESKGFVSHLAVPIFFTGQKAQTWWISRGAPSPATAPTSPWFGGRYFDHEEAASRACSPVTGLRMGGRRAKMWGRAGDMPIVLRKPRWFPQRNSPRYPCLDRGAEDLRW